MVDRQVARARQPHSARGGLRLLGENQIGRKAGDSREAGGPGGSFQEVAPGQAGVRLRAGVSLTHSAAE